MAYLKLIYGLLKSRIGYFKIERNRTLGGFSVVFSIYGFRAFKIRYNIFKKYWSKLRSK